MVKYLIRKYEDSIDNLYIRMLIKRLYKIPTEEWIGIWDTLNRWEMPISFYDIIPIYGYKGTAKSHDRLFKTITPVTKIIESTHSIKELLRFRNVRHETLKSDDEFEYWFANVRGNKNETGYYYRMSFVEGLKWWEDDVFKKLCDTFGWSYDEAEDKPTTKK